MTTTPPDDSTPADASAAPAPADAPAPQRERPRFGEYAPTTGAPVPPAPPAPSAAVTPPVAPAPQYAPPPAPAPQYTGYQSPLGTSAPGYAYPGQAVAPVAPRPKTVGIIAFVVGLVVLIGSPIASGFVAQGVSPLMSYYANGGIDVADIPADQLAAVSAAGVGVIATLLFAVIFGLWALIQGIVATATNRGRLFGILAIVCSVLAPIVSVIVFYAVLFAAAPELLQR
ncbi:hypothetical protein ACEXOS_010905 [Herbiconiux sp. P16]|uniref:hypothetical protein n=1 Tax=Herbiconiux wuyangfengii TaxID=3342794 RepID=UPI0035B6B8F2